MTGFKALWFEGPGRVGFREEKLGRLGPHEVTLQTRYSAVSKGSEALVLKGAVAPGHGLFAASSERKACFPFPYGYQVVGEVVEVGEKVSETLLGRWAFGFLPHAAYHQVEVSQLCFLPPDLDPIYGSFLGQMETAVNVVWDLRPYYREGVVVSGIGLLGGFVSVLLRSMGNEVYGLDPVPGKIERLKGIGGHGLREGEKSFALGVETSGHWDALLELTRVVGQGGRIVVASWYGDQALVPVLGTDFHRKKQTLYSSQVSELDPRLPQGLDKAYRLRCAKEALQALPQGFISFQKVPFLEAEAVYEQLLAGRWTESEVVFCYERGGGADV